MDLPHVAKHAFGEQMGPNMQKVMPFGSPPHQGLKIADFLIKIFLFGPQGDFCSLRAVGHISWLAYYLAILGLFGGSGRTEGKLNAAWVSVRSLF